MLSTYLRPLTVHDHSHRDLCTMRPLPARSSKPKNTATNGTWLPILQARQRARNELDAVVLPRQGANKHWLIRHTRHMMTVSSLAAALLGTVLVRYCLSLLLIWKPWHPKRWVDLCSRLRTPRIACRPVLCGTKPWHTVAGNLYGRYELRHVATWMLRACRACHVASGGFATFGGRRAEGTVPMT